MNPEGRFRFRITPGTLVAFVVIVGACAIANLLVELVGWFAALAFLLLFTLFDHWATQFGTHLIKRSRAEKLQARVSEAVAASPRPLPCSHRCLVPPIVMDDGCTDCGGRHCVECCQRAIIVGAAKMGELGWCRCALDPPGVLACCAACGGAVNLSQLERVIAAEQGGAIPSA